MAGQRGVLVPLKAFALSRGALFVFAWVTLALFPIKSGKRYWRAFPHNTALDGWARFDSGWYARIAKYGYQNIPMGDGQDTNFFPMYPLVIRTVGKIVGNIYLAGIIVSNAAFLLALIGLHGLVVKRYGPALAKRTVTLLAFNPFSFFYSAVYAEALFLFFLVYAFYLCENRRYFLAGVSAACAGATRNLGVFAFVGLGLLALRQRENAPRRLEARALWLLLAAVGPLAYSVFLWIRFNDPLLFLHAQRAWGTFSPLGNLTHIFNTFHTNRFLALGRLALFLLHAGVGIFSILLVLKVGKFLKMPYVIFSLLLILPGFLRLTSLGRYVMVVFPVFIALAMVTDKRWVYRGALAVEGCLLLLLSLMFTHWYWVA